MSKLNLNNKFLILQTESQNESILECLQKRSKKHIAKRVFKKTKKFDALPKEIILHVFEYLKVVDIIKCGQVSKRLRIISKQKRRTRKAIARPVCPEKYQQGFSKFEALPNEVILNVFSYLPTEDLPKCRMISKRFRDISDVLHKMQPPNLWEIGPSISQERSSNSSAVCYDSYRRFL